jgi:ribose/xylose/arabinose/galactoside ABC-type transport system permease subunit
MSSTLSSLDREGKVKSTVVRSTKPIVRARLILLTALIVAVAAVFSFLIPNFLTANSVANLLRQASVTAIVAFGATFVIVAGEIDLSVGSVVSLVAVLTAWTSRNSNPVPVMMVSAVATGLAIGAVNGFLILKLRVPSFLATLGMLSIVKGLAMTVSLQPIAVRSLDFIKFFSISLAGIPMPFFIVIVLFAVSFLLLNYSHFGVHTRAIGSNEKAARLAGLNTARHKYIVLMLGSLLAAIGGVVLAGRTNYGMAQSAGGLELDVIAAAILGGSRLGGGAGSIIGTTLGAVLLTMIFVGIANMGLPGPYQDIAKGALIGIATLLMRR